MNRTSLLLPLISLVSLASSFIPASAAPPGPLLPNGAQNAQPMLQRGAPPASTLVPTNVHPPGWHPPRFRGFVDLHTHPLSYLGFGSKLITGGLDVGSYLPTDSKCVHDTVAKSLEQALGTDNAVRGGWGAFDNPCGDSLRKTFFGVFESVNHAASIKDWARGFPADYTKPSTDGQDFADWPTWNDIDHQKMWDSSIRRAYDAGLRVMVALAVNNKTLADAVRGPGDTLPDDDGQSTQVQIQRTKEFVARHGDFMEVAYSSSDLSRIVTANKLAVLLGVEVDNLGNMNTAHPLTNQALTTIIHGLYQSGVRYVFPIHVLDNPLGGTAAYQPAFDVSNYLEAGHFLQLTCSQPADKITFNYSTASDLWTQLKTAGFSLVKLGKVPPGAPPSPTCPAGTGHMNTLGLSPLGEFALRQMMKEGMLIDIDHMSQKSANQALDIAESIPGGGYPLFSGHNNLRGGSIGRGADTEIARTAAQYKRIANLHGMAGVGTGELRADQFLQLYNAVIHASDMAPAGFGTDTDGLVMGMPPRPGSHVVYDANYPMSALGSHRWDYNRDGVAHYGMISDYLKDMASIPGSGGLLDSLMNGADYFMDCWVKAEAQKTKVQ